VHWSQFSLALAVSGLVSTLGSLGLPQAVARSLPYEADDSMRRQIIHTTYRVGVPAALGVGAILAVFGLPVSTTFHSPFLAITLEFFAAATVFTILSTLVASVFQGYEDVLPNALFVQVLNPALFIVFLLAGVDLLPSRLSYTGALVAYVISAGVSFLALLLYARRRMPKLLAPGERAAGVSRPLLAFALPLFFVSVFSFISGNGDTLVLGSFSQNSVGFYSADLPLARLLQVGIASLGYIFLPVTSRFVRTGERGAVEITYVTATKWMVLTSLPLFLVFFFLPGSSLTFVFGSQYASTTQALRILLVGAFASTLVGPAFMGQVAYGHTRLLFYNTLVAGAADLGIAFALVPSLGITGAAIAWSASNALFPILSLVELAVLERIHPFTRDYVVPLALTSVPVAGLLFLVSGVPTLWLLPPMVLAIAGLFLVVVVMTGSIDDGDRLLLEAVEGLLRRKVPFVRALAAVSRRIRYPGTEAPRGPP
jgi:O-antigen/teichoic acid export membrane protein